MATGRPSSFAPEIKKRILRALKDGNTRKTAAEVAGICCKTLQRWCQRGRSKSPDDTDYAAFVRSIKKAEAEAHEAAVKAIRQAGRKTWTALAWWLERKYPEEWSSDRELVRELKHFLRERKQKKEQDATTAKSAG